MNEIVWMNLAIWSGLYAQTEIAQLMALSPAIATLTAVASIMLIPALWVGFSLLRQKPI